MLLFSDLLKDLDLELQTDSCRLGGVGFKQALY